MEAAKQIHGQLGSVWKWIRNVNVKDSCESVITLTICDSTDDKTGNTRENTWRASRPHKVHRNSNLIVETLWKHAHSVRKTDANSLSSHGKKYIVHSDSRLLLKVLRSFAPVQHHYRPIILLCNWRPHLQGLAFQIRLLAAKAHKLQVLAGQTFAWQ